ncbi:MAG: hypothetical protein HKL95_02865 [Phycisphaerae bacterium]|nr:hypothetical protein [Phycisphaerae bacterium]
MDYALAVATALGALSIYLLLPRGRGSLVKTGALVGVLTLGVAILYLVRWVGHHEAVGQGAGLGIFFYLFAIIAVISATAVICHPRPLYSALYFVLLTLAMAGLFILLLAQFMAIVLIIIYAGAILVTYIFVIMLASPGGNVAVADYDRVTPDPLLAVLVSFVLLGTVLQLMFIGQPRTFMAARPVRAVAVGVIRGHQSLSDKPALRIGGMELLGVNLYSQYALPLELAGILLTISLVGAVMIARKNVPVAGVLGTGQMPVE